MACTDDDEDSDDDDGDIEDKDNSVSNNHDNDTRMILQHCAVCYVLCVLQCDDHDSP